MHVRVQVQLVSVRRTLFSSQKARQDYLGQFLDGIVNVIGGQIGLDDAQNYHELCRLLARIRPNFQLTGVWACAAAAAADRRHARD